MIISESPRHRLAKRILADAGELAGLGVHVFIGTDEILDRRTVTVEVYAESRARAETLLRARYGPSIVVSYLGKPTPTDDIEWQDYEELLPGLVVLRYHTIDPNSVVRTSVAERDEEVVIAVSEARREFLLRPARCRRSTSVQLSAPVGRRRLVDGVTGETRESRR